MTKAPTMLCKQKIRPRHRDVKENIDLIGKNGGRDRDRTCDPYHVKVVLFR